MEDPGRVGAAEAAGNVFMREDVLGHEFWVRYQKKESRMRRATERNCGAKSHTTILAPA